MGCSESTSKRDVYGNTVPPQETRKRWTDNLALPLKQLEKEERNPKLVEGKKS